MCRFPQCIHLFPRIFVYTSLHAQVLHLKERCHGNRLDNLHSDTQETSSHIHWAHNMGSPRHTKMEKNGSLARMAYHADNQDKQWRSCEQNVKEYGG